MLKKEHLMGAGLIILPFLFLSGAPTMGEPIRMAKEMALIALGSMVGAWYLHKHMHWIASLVVLFIGYNTIVTGFGPAQKDAIVSVLCSLAVAKFILDLDEDGRMFLLKCLSFAGVFQGLLGLIQFSGHDPLELLGFDPLFLRINKVGYNWPYGTFGQPTVYGAFMAICFTASVFTRRWVSAFIAGIAVLLTISTFSILSAATGLMAYLFLCVNRRITSYVAVFGIILLGVLFSVRDKNAFLFNVFYDHQRFNVWESVVGATLNGCTFIGKVGEDGKVTENNDLIACTKNPKIPDGYVAVRMLLSRPIKGYGLGSFKALYYNIQTRNSQEQSGSYRQAHNDYLQILFEGGLIGFFLAIVVVCFFAYRLLFNHLTYSQLAFGGVGASILVDSLGSFPLYLMPHGMILCVALVVVIAGSERLKLLEP